MKTNTNNLLKDIYLQKFGSDYAPVWGLFIGGSGVEQWPDLATRGTETYVVGYTGSGNFPTHAYTPNNNSYNEATYSGPSGFIIRVTSSGLIKWSTYIPSGALLSIQSLPNFDIVATGFGGGGNFPYKDPSGASDYFYSYSSGGIICAFDDQAVQKWATNFSKATSLADEWITDVSADNSGNIFITGMAPDDATFPIVGSGYTHSHNGEAYDAFIAKFNSDYELLWSTYYGSNKNDRAWAICNDNDGNVYVTGTYENLSGGGNFPAFSSSGNFNVSTYGGGDYDAFLLKFDNDGYRQWSTLLGGNSWDDALDICSDGNNIYLHGEAASSDFPVQSYGNFYDQSISNGGGMDAYIAIFNSNTDLIYSTYFGGQGAEQGKGIYVLYDKLYITGVAFHATLPPVPPIPLVNPGTPAYFQSVPNSGEYDGYIAKLDMGYLTSTPDFNDENKITFLYPNPTSDLINFKPSDCTGKISLSIIDITGKIISEKNYETCPDKITIDISNYSAGIYLLRAVTNNGVVVNKIIKT